ncbi:FliH/SctL family protein [Candidatus Igneacidithiobacillus taiwanensis]|uniref:FliH/SctL family protein n=1 Tax=Candidatus Igneacidithiobacillus taiwanensis TaxID=1945924 RepID=UPI00289D10D3|nr:FliH/SctL family protein [Candidatus Igneacidithiobacillus taiwanensis]
MPASEAEIIQREAIEKLLRWQMPQVIGARQGAVEANTDLPGEELAVTDLRPPTAQDLQDLVARVEQEARERGYAEGFRRGEEEGRRQGEEAAMRLGEADAAALRSLLLAAREPLQRVDEGVEQALLALALEVARQVIRHELRLRPELLLPLVQEALRSLPTLSASPMLRLHPEDLDLVAARLPDLGAAGVRLEADETLERGSLVLQAGMDPELSRPDRRWRERQDAAATELDLRLASRWRQVMEQLFSGFEG